MGAGAVKARVFVTDHPFPSFDAERAVLDPLGVEFEVAAGTDEETLAAGAREADALLVCYAPVGARVVRAAAEGGCRIVARYGIGVDNVDVEEASRAGIVVTNVPDYCLDEVADHALALLLAIARGVAPAAADVRAGGWRLPELPVVRLRGRRLALVGVGRIGRRVAARARAFGLDVVGYDPYVGEWDVADAARAESLEEALADADFVSLHAPLTEETRHLVRDETIAMMRRAPVVVNTARGGLVDLDAAVRALDAGRLLAVALDVTDPEPLPEDHPLRDHPRALVTPHIAYHSSEAQEELQRRAAEEVARALRGEAPRCPVNAHALAAAR
jgi:D-3-phosphoglycerate dehydrogenase